MILDPNQETEAEESAEAESVADPSQQAVEPQPKVQPEQQALKHANDFLNDHDQPSPGRLRRLAKEHSFYSLEQLRQLADDYNVTYDDTTTSEELYDRISLRMEQEADNSKLS